MNYKRNFLTDVIVRIDFPVILSLTNDTPKEFQEKISKDFPILDPMQELTFKITQNPMETLNSKKRVIWSFKSKSKDKIIELQDNSLAINFKKYEDFDDFMSCAEIIPDIFFSIYPEIIVNKFGLRYINQISLKEKGVFDWSQYINEKLLKNIEFIEDKNKIRRIINHLEVSPDEDTLLVFKYGIFNNTYPAAVTKKEFVLDYDCYTRVTFDRNQFNSKVKSYHKLIKNEFEKSITPAFRGVLNNE